jgi:hypothetical protein
MKKHKAASKGFLKALANDREIARQKPRKMSVAGKDYVVHTIRAGLSWKTECGRVSSEVNCMPLGTVPYPRKEEHCQRCATLWAKANPETVKRIDEAFASQKTVTVTADQIGYVNPHTFVELGAAFRAVREKVESWNGKTDHAWRLMDELRAFFKKRAEK